MATYLTNYCSLSDEHKHNQMADSWSSLSCSEWSFFNLLNHMLTQIITPFPSLKYDRGYRNESIWRKVIFCLKICLCHDITISTKLCKLFQSEMYHRLSIHCGPMDTILYTVCYNLYPENGYLHGREDTISFSFLPMCNFYINNEIYLHKIRPINSVVPSISIGILVVYLHHGAAGYIVYHLSEG